MNQERGRRTSSGNELLFSGGLLALFGVVALFFLAQDGTLGIWAPGWFLAFAGIPTGIALTVVGILRRRKDRR